jgi:hypothetical protein
MGSYGVLDGAAETAECPNCGEPLRALVLEEYSGVLLCTVDGAWDYNTWDADIVQSYVERIWCNRCSFASEDPDELERILEEATECEVTHDIAKED